MIAAVLYGSENLKIENVLIPTLAADEALIRVKVALTCGTDLKVWKRGYHARMITPPAVFGHELSGVVESLGSDVNGGLKVGARVVPSNSAPCNVCLFCRKGQTNLCEDLLFNNGAYAEYIRIPGRIVRQNMLEIPAHVSFQDAAMVEPLACVLRGIHETGIQPGRHHGRDRLRPYRIEVHPHSLRAWRQCDRSGQASQSNSRRGKIRRPRGAYRNRTERSREGCAGFDGRMPRSRFGDRGGGHADDVAMGPANGASRRDREPFWRLLSRHAGPGGSQRAALFRDHD